MKTATRITGLLFVFLLFSLSFISAQSLKGFNYQAVARDGNGLIMANSNINLRFQLREGSENGTIIYQETHAPMTNDYGLFTAIIGSGTVEIGDWNTVTWGNNDYFLGVEINGAALGTSQLVSVPYSKVATQMDLNQLQNVDAATPSQDQILKWDGTVWVATDETNNTYTAGAGIAINGNSIENTAPDQTVSLAGSGATNISGSYPNFTISSTDNVDDADADPANEIQDLSISGSSLSITGGNSVNLPEYTAGTGISISGTTITNTGDTNPGNDITTGSSAGGDLSGTYPNPSVEAIHGNAISGTMPSINQVLKWNGSQWAPANDNAGSNVWSTSGTNAYYNSGDVGIGTSSIDAKMEIYSNGSLNDPQLQLHENGNDYARIRFQNNNGTNYWSIASYIASSNQNDRFNIWNGTTGDILTITGDGEMGLNVGISPKVSFHVGEDHRVLFGQDTLGDGPKLLWLPDLGVFRVGTLSSNTYSTYWNRDSLGSFSFASGLNTRATAYGSTAMGAYSWADNSYSFASGYFAEAKGFGSVALGYQSEAIGNYTNAIGRYTEAVAYGSTAIGRYNLGFGTTNTWSGIDPVFEIGIGTSTTNRANALTVFQDGDVGIGTTLPEARLHVSGGNIQVGTFEQLSDEGNALLGSNSTFVPTANNSFHLGSSARRWNTIYATNGTINTSDLRQKENVQDLNYGLGEIMQLRPVSFSWIDQPEYGTKIGLIAQEVQEVVSEVVQDTEWVLVDEDSGEKEEVAADAMGIFYSDLIPVLIKGMQEQQEQIEALQAEILTLKQQIENK